MYDAAIIGAGIIGSMVARQLMAYNVSVCVVEKKNDVATGATCANSAIVHAGFDAKSGSLKALLNVKGSQMMENTAKELGVEYLKNGSLVVGFDQCDKKIIEDLYKRGLENGVSDVEIIDADRIRQLEPGISDDVVCALYAPTGAIVSPYELAIAAMGNAMDNGAVLERNFDVTDILYEDGIYTLVSGDKTIKAKYVVNAAGVHSDTIAAMVGDTSFTITPRRGEYILLDKPQNKLVNHTVFSVPGKMGKGILVTPTVHGNILLGPTSVDMDEKDNTSVTDKGIQEVIAKASKSIKDIPLRTAITTFCGIRATGSTGDFIINSPKKGFVNAAAIESPGLSASPAIAEMVVEMLINQGLTNQKNTDFSPIRKPMNYFRNATIEQKNEMIKQNPDYGKIICRCEGISKGEITDALHTNPVPYDTDGIKRRTRAQMGRCQGGFCLPYIMDIIQKELGTEFDKITKSGGDSRIATGKTKETL